jgi:hypothetical protein
MYITIEILHENLTFEDEHKVIDNPLGKTTYCSCRHFERIRILCTI